MPRHKIATASAPGPHRSCIRQSSNGASLEAGAFILHPKPVSGMRQRPCGLRASPLHMGFDRSAMLSTGLGFGSVETGHALARPMRFSLEAVLGKFAL